ncbi:hypothetical protein EV05_1602 [Prochlorococcus sp. MIT 0601]|nr:hypothetical protein EV05_1602 [Prochlorococcus sp. MIT 0601]
MKHHILSIKLGNNIFYKNKKKQCKKKKCSNWKGGKCICAK